MSTSDKNSAFIEVVEEVEKLYPEGSITRSEAIEAARNLPLFYKTLLSIKKRHLNENSNDQ